MLAQYLDRSWGRLVFYFVILCVAGFLTFWVVSLRILQSLALGFTEKPVVWADIILSGLALARLSMLWPSIVDWISRRRAA